MNRTRPLTPPATRRWPRTANVALTYIYSFNPFMEYVTNTFWTMLSWTQEITSYLPFAGRSTAPSILDKDDLDRNRNKGPLP